MAKTILVVEDEESLKNVLCAKLRKEDFKVLEAKNGQEGLVLALAEQPDLIFLDIVMPVMDGLTMVEKLREAEKETGGHIPVIFLTNLSDEKTLSAGQKEGIYDYLVKSAWTLDGIVKRAKSTLGL